jgi:membrane protein DedA with SNARE-associated domain
MHGLEGTLLDVVRGFKDLGVFVAMFFESSVVPIPSEAIIVAAAAIGIPLKSIVIFGSLGSTAGAIVGYALGRYAAMPTILKFGKYILIKPHHIYKAEGFAKKYGAWGVLIGRILPIIPFKVFSIASGITKVSIVPFIICTAVGVVPRIFLLALFGDSLVKYTKPTVLAFLLLAAAFLAFKVTRMIYNGKKRGGLR